MGEDHRPVFLFVDSPDLRANSEEYLKATVLASSYDRAGTMLRKLIREARFRRIAWEERLVTGVDISQSPRSSETGAE